MPEAVTLLANVDVDDLARGVDFYTRGIGLRIGRRFGAQALELLGAGAPIYLLKKASGTPGGGAQPRDYRRHWTPVHLDFAVANIEAAVAQACAAGALLEGGINTYKWGRLATLSDPFGNGFCLIEFLGRGYDEIAS